MARDLSIQARDLSIQARDLSIQARVLIMKPFGIAIIRSHVAISRGGNECSCQILEGVYRSYCDFAIGSLNLS
ncbi:hypothetical protein BB934_05210 [Microvirga ossetica]|uniref:Uncharacterized protein n=1 Tax=Microvirga ossetica TaxID=1882682 RepID=A0A1B2ECL0_9HYPH|nr:hypothetical protein BB934_05210 [Microvirga ossetica]